MALPDTLTPIRHQDDKENDDSPVESNACKSLTKEKYFDLPPVSPHSSGEGLPYAPEGWPNPGDVWGWKVANRTNKAGYFADRHLYLPKSLQISSHSRRSLRTKPDVERYIESNFPNMEVQAFFDLFSWQIPFNGKTPTKGIQSFPITPPGKSLETGEDATEEIGTKRQLKQKIQICCQPTRKSSRLLHVHPPLASNEVANIIIDFCSSAPDQDATGISDFCILSEEARIDATENSKGVSESDEGTGEKYPKENVLENFSDYIVNLEDMLDKPHIEASPNHVASASIPNNEMIECCKKKLSSLLAVDFSSLFSCNDVVEFATLASQIRKDPTLSADQLTQLKLVEQIPLVCEAFLDAKGDIEEAEKFLGDLEAKKQKVLSMKNECRDRVAQIESDMAGSSLAIKEIDDQIRQLESKRNEICSALEMMQKSKANVVNSFVTLVDEIQVELREKSKWELKKANSAQRVAEIQEKFSTLKGLTF